MSKDKQTEEYQAGRFRASEATLHKLNQGGVISGQLFTKEQVEAEKQKAVKEFAIELKKRAKGIAVGVPMVDLSSIDSLLQKQGDK